MSTDEPSPEGPYLSARYNDVGLITVDQVRDFDQGFATSSHTTSSTSR